MLNIEKYSKRIWNQMEEEGDDLLSAMYDVIGRVSDINVYDDDALFEWLLTEEDKNAILNKEEKEYLSNIIKPFRKKITRVEKKNFYVNKINHKEDFVEGEIQITYINNVSEELAIIPFFNDTMFKKMEECKGYTLQELEL